MPAALPTGTVTFLFSDVEGSTKLLHDLGTAAYARVLIEHRERMRAAFTAGGGVEVGTEGDSFFVAFPTAPGALGAAHAAQAALADLPLRVRVGIHTGTPDVIDGDYLGMDVHRAARIAAAGHGGQVLVSAATVALAGTSGLRDLGEHRLKDLAAPERIWQLGDGEFPPLRSLQHTNLPVAPTPFIGRERELAEVGALLDRGEVRMVTLTGPGGTGKTRLAMQAAAEAAERYPHGTWWVPLEALRDPDLVLQAAAAALGVKSDLATYLTDKRLLIAFDNFEQVVAGAPALARLLAACRGIDLVITSREPLRIRGEREYSVPPLAHAEAVRLFVERAQELGRTVAADAAVSEICRRLDDLPLAIELAAVRTKVLTPAQIAKRLEQRLPLLTSGARDLPERQRTLRGAIEWSHELLSAEEQRLFARLAVFRGGWTLEAAEAVSEADLDTLQSLVEKSLVRQEGDRFAMLQTIREYAAERLAASGEEEEQRRRHADHFVGVANEAEPHVRLDSPVWTDRLEREHDNLRTALDTLAAVDDAQTLLALAGTLARFWYLKSHLVEGRRRLETALAADARPTAARAKALMGASVIYLNLGDAGRARSRAEEALQLSRSLGDAWGVAYSTMMVGNALGETPGELPAARLAIEDSLRLFRELGDEHYGSVAMANLGWMLEDLGDKERSRAMFDEVLRGARAREDERGVGFALAQLATQARDDGRLAEAASMLREAIRIAHEQGNTQELGYDLARLASVLVRGAEPQTAARLVGASSAILDQLGMVDDSGWNERRNVETRRMLLEAVGEADLAGFIAEGHALTRDQAVALALGGEGGIRTHGAFTH